MMDRQTLGKLLRQHRLAAGLTQQQLAERAGMSTRSIGYLESGNGHVPRGDTTRLLTEALQLSADDEARFLRAAGRLPGTTGNGALPATSPAAPAAPLLQPPLPPTPLIGREGELEALRALLGTPGGRLVTLTGPGGVGKTHLALALAHQMSEAFPDGVTFVDLAPLTEAEAVLFALAQALEVREQSNAPLLAQVRQRLQGQRRLLVLDTFEHLLPAASALAELLAGCPALTLLVTSRAPLRLRGERISHLAPLALPQEADRTPLEDLAATPAVALFLARAQEHAPAFTLSAENAASVAAICRRLDGLPLALELAAPRLALLSPDTLLERLQAPLVLLTQGARDLPARQRTLRATLTWSYDLLPEAAQAMLRRLAVFAGGAGWEAIAQLGATGAEDEALEIADVLIAHHLVQPAPSATTEERVSLLDTIRAFGRDLLRARGELETTERAYAGYYLRLAEAAVERFDGPEQQRWLERLDREQDNLRAVLSWALAHREVALGTHLGVALWRYWSARGALTEGRRWLEAFLALVETAPEVETAGAEAVASNRLINAAGILAKQQGDYARARALFETSLAHSQRIGDQRRMAASLNQLADLAIRRYDPAQAIPLFQQSVDLLRRLPEPSPPELAGALNNLAISLAEYGDYAQAEAIYAECLRMRRAIGNPQALANTLHNLGNCAILQGDLARAITLLDESRQLLEQMGDSLHLASVLLSKGEAHRVAAEPAQALAAYQRCWRLFEHMQAAHGMIHCAEELVLLAVDLNCEEEARALWRLADGLREAHEIPLTPPEDKDLKRFLRRLPLSPADHAPHALDGDAPSHTIESIIGRLQAATRLSVNSGEAIRARSAGD